MKNIAIQTSLAASLCAATVLVGATQLPASTSARHYSDWSSATPVTEVNVPNVNDGCPIESPDGLELYVASNRPGTPGDNDNDIWVFERASKDSPWGEAQNLGPQVNSPANDYCPTPLPGGWLLFVSERPVEAPCSAGAGSGDIYIVHRSRAHGWGEPRHLGCVAAGNGPNSPGPEFSPSLVATGKGAFLYFSSNGGSGLQDIYVSQLGDGGIFAPPVVVAELSTPSDDRMPNVSKDGLEIVFSSTRPSWGGGQAVAGGQDVYTARRDSVTGVWSDPVNVSSVNTAGNETRASMSRDRVRLHFGRDGDVFTSTREARRGKRPEQRPHRH